MSIITDALRKAEEKRGFKPKHAVEKVLIQADLDQEELLKRFGYEKSNAEETVSLSKPLHIKPPVNIFVSVLQKTLISLSLILVCFFVVYLGPRWLLNPGSFSEDLSFFKSGAIFQIDLSIPEKPTSEISPVINPVTEEAVFASSQNEIKQKDLVSVPDQIVAGDPESTYILSGISIMGKDRYAVINGAIVQKGESIDGAYVKDILDREVILETRSAEIKLKIPV
jgi:hypothetical protein